MKKEGLNLVIEELKQRLTAKKTNVKRYEQMISEFRQNQLVQINQKQVYKELNEEQQEQIVTPNTEESIKFWSDICNIRKGHTERLKDCRK